MKRRNAAALVVLCAGVWGLGSAMAGCGKGLPPCDVADYAANVFGDNLPNDCGTYPAGNPSLDASAMASAQTCVVNAAQAKQPFQMEYDQVLRVNTPNDAGDFGPASIEGTRVGWIGDIGTGSLVIQWYEQPILDDAGTLGELSMRTCDGIVGGADCVPVAPADKPMPLDPVDSRIPGPVVDACLVCVNPGPEQRVCQP